MHPYSLDTNEHKLVPLFLAITAICSAWLLSKLLIEFSLEVPWWFDAPSVMGFYGLFYAIFDTYLWKIKLLSTLRLIKTPILSGEWHGTISSSFNGGSNTNAKLTIKQNWASIQIVLTTENSTSCSLVASLALESAGGAVLTYQYQNDPRAGADTSMQIHYGTARLILNGNSLTGDYYSGRGRQNTGELSFTRVVS